MKELYIAPELELLCLVAEEKLATNNELDFDDLLGTKGEGVSVDPDLDIDVPLN